MMKLISAISKTPRQVVGRKRLNSVEGIEFRGNGFHAAPGCDVDRQGADLWGESMRGADPGLPEEGREGRWKEIEEGKPVSGMEEFHQGRGEIDWTVDGNSGWSREERKVDHRGEEEAERPGELRRGDGNSS